MGARSQPSGAEARIYFQRLAARVELVPFPKPRFLVSLLFVSTFLVSTMFVFTLKDVGQSAGKNSEIGGVPVIFQDVVHSIGTGEADCDEQSSFRGQTEWTSTRMPDSRFAVERR